MANEQVPSLFPTVRDVEAPPGRGQHGYYRTPDGRIVTAMTTPANRAGYEYKGFTFLKEYGEFSYGTPWGNTDTDINDVPFNPYTEPWRLIFQKGGAHEFTVAQIISHGWHLKPPYAEVVFPQLEGIEIVDLPCPECKRVFSDVEKGKVTGDLRTHLVSGVNRPHSYTPADLRELGKEWELDFDSVRNRNVDRYVAPEGAQDAPVEPPGEPERDTEHVCDYDGCDWAPQVGHARPALALTGHKLSHKRKERAAAEAAAQTPEPVEVPA